jgi:Protein of unknown function (DUF2742)
MSRPNEPPIKREAPAPTRTTPKDTTTSIPPLISSQQVNWLTVREYVAAALAAAGSWPMVGTPAWCALDDYDPAKTAAIFDAAQHWALRVETCQQAQCQASRGISAAEDWSSISREIKCRRDLYAQRPWLRREIA